MKKLDSIIYIVTIETITGLHIGGGEEGIEIGGIDNAVIKDKDGYPYIPGSSLKGKMRSLIEVSEGKFDKDGKNKDGKNKGGPHKFGSEECSGSNCLICRAFGVAGDKGTEEELAKVGPTRMLVRDLTLSEDSKDTEGKVTKGSRTKFDEMIRNGENPLEEKTEVMINRSSGTAAKSGPRSLERVPAGTVFEGEIVFRVFDTGHKGQKNGDITRDEEIAEELFGEKDNLLKKLIENDYLGGLGSRGSGQIEIDFTIKS